MPHPDPIYRRLAQFTQILPTTPRHKSIAVYVPESTTATITQLATRANIHIDLPLDKFHLPSHPEPYIAFLHLEDGTARKGQPPSLRPQTGRGLTILEGLQLAAAWPDILDDHAIDLIESRYSLECVPTIYKWHNQLHLSAICPDVRDHLCGAPIVHHELRFTLREWPTLTDKSFQSALESIKTHTNF